MLFTSKMKDRVSWRVKAGVVLLFASANIYAIEICRRTHVLTAGPTDHITLNEMRLAELRKRLSADEVVGYIADDFDNVDRDKAWREFATTQYSLAPVILDRTTAHKLVVGNFKDPSSIPTVAARNNLLLIEDFGSGVVLFEKK